MADPVVVHRDGAIATIVLSNPERLNALDKTMWRRLGETVRELSADDRLRCVVVRGAGEKAFIAGADIAEFTTERADSKQAREYGALVHETMQSLGACRHPVVALIRGACIGGGLEIAALCDLRICGESSRFGIPVNRLGVALARGGLAGVLALAGRAVALEILLEGRVFDAHEALRKRLVNRVAPDDRVEAEAYALAARIAEGAPLVARWHKQYVERLGVRARLSDGQWDEGFACFDTQDYHEGVRAFLTKRKPEFRGR